jgi:LysR family glycine cleavage system transcriptional activator
MNRKLQLTDPGALYLARIRKVFDQIDEASRDIAEMGGLERLTLAVPPSLLATWIIPRLSQFTKRHPAIQLRFLDTLRHVDFDQEQIDAAIWYGFHDWPDLYTEHLFDEHLVPVCSPLLAQGPRPLCRLQDLQHHSLIHTERRLVKWGMVLRAADCGDIDTGQGMRFLHSIQSLRAAAQGLGVALAERLGAIDEVNTGRLVIPFELPVQVQPSPSYFFVCPPGALALPRVQLARKWLVEELVNATADSVVNSIAQ